VRPLDTLNRRVVLATLNPGKLRELARLLGDLPIELLSLADIPGATLPEETARTYADNALLKARAAQRLTGCAALGDDSGLEVDALGGAPGVLSARYAGGPEMERGGLRPTREEADAANNAKLLAALAYKPATAPAG